MEWTEKENRIADIALHKCRIESACIFELLKPLSIKHVFVYRTVTLYLDTGGVSDRKRSSQLAWFKCHRLLTLLYQELTKILSKKKKKTWFRKWILCQEPWVALSMGLGAFKRQTGQHLTVALKENMKNKSRCLLPYGTGHYKEIVFTGEKIFTVEESFNKQNNKV